MSRTTPNDDSSDRNKISESAQDLRKSTSYDDEQECQIRSTSTAKLSAESRLVLRHLIFSTLVSLLLYHYKYEGRSLSIHNNILQAGECW